MRELYQSKENRDIRALELKGHGVKFTKSSSGPSQIHPQYVIDYPDKSIQADNGFGNVHYKTYFKKLYAIEREYQ